MQRFLLSLVVLFISSQLLAQSIEDIEAQFAKGEFDKAKTAVDNFLAKEKNQSKADGWWYKGVVYNEIAKSDKYKNLVPDGRMDAFNAFKKYYELDAKAVRATLEQHVRLFDIYNGYFDNAVASFGTQKFEDAYNGFKNALMIEEYIAGKGYEYNGFKFSAFDTTLVQNIALSAYRAEKHDDAVVYYKKIADQRIAGKDNIDVYHLLAEYYQKKNDKASREKYLQMGRELYPDEPRWYQMELDEVDEKDKKALFAKYDELLPKYPKTYVLHYNYAVELFNYSLSDPKPADIKEIQAKFETIVDKAIAVDKTHPEPSFLIAGYYYNMIYDIQDEQRAIKGTTPADQKKKTDIKARMVVVADKMLPYAQAAFDIYNTKATLKASEKGNFKKLAGYISTAYEVKGDKAKADEFTKKQDSIQQ